MRQDQADRSCTPIANSLDGTHFGGRLLTQGLLVAPLRASHQVPAEMNHRVLSVDQTGSWTYRLMLSTIAMRR